jgi:hypothetical protein
MIDRVMLELLAYDIAESLDMPEGYCIQPDFAHGNLLVSGRYLGFVIQPNSDDVQFIPVYQMEEIHKQFAELLRHDHAN